MENLMQPMPVSASVLNQLAKIKENANAAGVTTFSHAELISLEQKVVEDNGDAWLSPLNAKNHDTNNEKIVRFIMFMNGNTQVFKKRVDAQGF